MSRIRILAAGAFLVAGCGGAVALPDAGQARFDAPPFQTVTSDSGQLHVSVQGDPSPPARGNDGIQLTITDGSGAPVSGLTLVVQPWMPEMGHGSSVKPTVTALDGGVYDLSNVYLSMPGRWELRVTVSGSVRDHVAPSFQID